MRPSNEDQFLSAELTKAMRIRATSLPEPKAQFGMERGHLFLAWPTAWPGHRAGEHASALAVVAIEQFTLNTFKWFFDSNAPEAQEGPRAEFRRHSAKLTRASLEEATEHRGIWRDGHYGDDGVPARSHSSVSSTLGTAERNCMGDATITFRLNAVTILLWRRWSARGEIRPDESSGDRLRHVITNVVGGALKVGVHVEALTPLNVHAGDRLLPGNARGGLTEMMTEDAIAAILTTGCATRIRRPSRPASSGGARRRRSRRPRFNISRC